MVDRSKAVALRQQGFSYKQIAKELGCSESWCKKELKGVQQDSTKAEIDSTKIAAVAILKEALCRLEAL